MRIAPGTPIIDFRVTWSKVVTAACCPDLLFHDLRRPAVRNMVQNFGIESSAVLISGHLTRDMLTRYNITSVAEIEEAGKKMDEAVKKLRKQQLSNNRARKRH